MRSAVIAVDQSVGLDSSRGTRYYTDMSIKIENATITSASVGMRDHAGLTASIVLEGRGWGCSFGGGYKQGHSLDLFMLGVLECVDVRSWDKLVGQSVRVHTGGPGGMIKRIEHIVKDRHFDIDEWTAAAGKRELALSAPA